MKLIYHRNSNTTFLMIKGTCMNTWRGYKKMRCSCGQGWVYPREVKKCPV